MKTLLAFLLVCAAALATLGIVMLYSTTFSPGDISRFRLHLVWLGLGLLIVPLLMLADYEWYNKKPFLYVLAGLALASLLAVFVPGIGVKMNGACRWLRWLGQPSEFAKPAVILLLAGCCARINEQEMRDFKRGFLRPVLLGGVPAALVFAQPDWGTAFLIGATSFVILFLAGARVSYLAGAAVLAILSAAAMLSHDPVRLDRIMVFRDPEAFRHGAGWQVWQSLLAIGSGGLQGDFLEGSLHKYGYVPEQQSDFIFSRIGEETGFWGTSLTVLLCLGILYCGLQIMKRTPDRFGRLLAGGCTTVIVLQAWVNLAVATSLVPNKGLPLPFVSYGGSSMLAMAICLGLLASVAWHAMKMEHTPLPNFCLQAVLPFPLKTSASANPFRGP